MAEVKVRFALVTYTTKDIYGKDYTANAFRGQTIDVADERELQRLRELNAVVDTSIELERPGRMMQIAESPTDEELLTWVAAAAPDEIRALAQERPNLLPRLVGAKEVADRNYQRQMELLGRATDIARDHLGENATVHAMSGAVGPEPFSTGTGTDVIFATPPLSPAAPAVSGGSDPSIPGDVTVEGTGDGPEGDPNTSVDPNASLDSETIRLDEIVSGNADSVKNYIADHPREASAILEAENRRAEAESREPRVSVIRAVEAAAAHTQ